MAKKTELLALRLTMEQVEKVEAIMNRYELKNTSESIRFIIDAFEDDGATEELKKLKSILKELGE